MRLSKLNHLTTNEELTIIASLKYLYEPQFRCMELSRWTKGEGRNSIVLPQSEIDLHRSVKGCFKPLTKKSRITELNLVHNNVLFRRCVCNYFTPQIHYLISLSHHYREHYTVPQDYIYEYGRLTNKVQEAIDIINSFVMDLERKTLKAATSSN